MIYADYEFYKENWSGKISEEEYNVLAIKSANAMNYFTFGRINKESITDKIKYCQCEIADYLFQKDISLGINENHSPAIKSETVDTHKIEYAVSVSASGDLNKTDRNILSICKEWLTTPINLMYSGGLYGCK